VDYCAISILGAIQPDKLKPMAAGLASDGLLQRFLPVTLKRINDGEDEYPDEELELTVSRLALVIAEADTGYFRFAPDADSELQALQSFKNRRLARSEAQPKLKEWLDKTPNEFARLSLVFHFIRWAASLDKEQADRSADAIWAARPADTISRETAAMARRFLEEFIYPHAVEFYGRMLGHSATDDHATWIAEYILAHGRATISNREIMHSYSALSAADKHGLRLAAMATLETHGWVNPTAFKRDGNPTAWNVNPAVHDGRFADVKAREEARRAAVREAIARDGASRRQSPTDANKRQQRPARLH
jgi:hypothetical protein